MAVYNGPPRGGSRGGRDQFNWEDVKADKEREYYLGHSVKALTGRWQKGKDVYWYTRGKGEENTGNLDAELQTVKAHEEQLMAEVALSFHWRTLRLAAVHRSQREILPSKLMFLNPHDMDAAMPINAQMRLSVELDDGIK
jgi:hypothetical protein